MSAELDLRGSVVRVCREDVKVICLGKSKKENKEGKGREGGVRKRKCEYMYVSGMCWSV